MINSKKILEKFSKEVPIFPLPNFVMFPKTAYSFNIYEERYKKLFSDIISSNKLFCISLLEEHINHEYYLSPTFYNIGTLCYIIDYKKIKNGNYKIIASGLKRVKIIEKDTNLIYRIVKTNFINESKFIQEEDLRRKKLINKFISLISSNSETINLKLIDYSSISTEMLVNLAALILPLDKFDKQKLLELSDISLRLDVLCQYMESELNIESEMLNIRKIIPSNSNLN